MPTIHFDKRGSFSNVEDLSMVLYDSTNNSVEIAQKVGYTFVGWYYAYETGGHIDETAVTVLNDDGSITKVTEDVTVYTENGSFIMRYIPESDEPERIDLIKVYDSNGQAVQSDLFWSDDYPNGIYINDKDVTLYPEWAPVPFIKDYYTPSDERCHLYLEIDGILTRVEVEHA